MYVERKKLKKGLDRVKDIKVIVTTHKKYKMPSDQMYLPVRVGADIENDNFGYQADNVGENISSKNPYYCELTGLYWAWKNLKADYIGLAHYRRHFSIQKKLPKGIDERVEKALTLEEADKILENVDVILSKKRRYYIETIYSHYKHTMYVEPLDETKKILEEKYPEYLKEFNKLSKATSAHMFNMFIMKRELLDEYCNWLFDILFELEKRIDASKYNNFHARFFGRISEILLNIWINKNNIKYEEVNVIDIEKINWIKKGSSFLMAKFTGKKYKKSF